LAQSQSLLIISLLISLACAVLCGVIAAAAGRAGCIGRHGFAFGPFALPFVFMAKPGPGSQQALKAVTASQASRACAPHIQRRNM